MERSIVHAFKRLRVLTPNFKFRGNMDDLVNDLSHALEESSCCQSRVITGRNRRRRGRRRRSKMISANNASCNIPMTSKQRNSILSEDSESSLDLSSVSQYYSKNKDALSQDSERMLPSTMSDTDDVNVIQRFQHKINIPQHPMNIRSQKQNSGVSVGESDSFNENFSPVRPLRRRRKFKRMDVDCCSPVVDKNEASTSLDQNISVAINNPDSSVLVNDAMDDYHYTCGKRKRNSKERGCEEVEEAICTQGSEISINRNHEISYCYRMLCNNESSVSSLSSSESDTDFFKCDEGREADDEQSDFFCESGPSCGIPGIQSWEVNKDDSEMYNPKIEQILGGCIDQMSSCNHNMLKIRKMKNRDIRTGLRRLPLSKRPQSKVTSIEEIISEFIKDPNQNELCLPPLSKKEKEQLLNLGSIYSLKIKFDGHNPKKRAILMKTGNASKKGNSVNETVSNIQNNNSVNSEIKRRKKTPCDLSMVHLSYSPEQLTDENFSTNIEWDSDSGSNINIKLSNGPSHPRHRYLNAGQSCSSAESRVVS